MCYAHTRTKCLEHIAISVGEELIACVVTRQTDRHSSFGQLFYSCHTSVRWCHFTGWISILQPLIHRGERNDSDTSFTSGMNDALRFFPRLSGEGTAMSADHRSFELIANDRLGNIQ